MVHPYPGFSGIIYPGFSRDPRKHWAKNIFGRVQNRSRLSVRAVRAFGRDTKTDDAGAAAQPKRRGRGAVRRANGLSADSTLDFRCRFARHRASPASFRPSGRPRAVGHETLRVTKGHENARPSVVSDKRRCQAAQAASGNANSSWSGSHVLPHMTLVASCGVFVIFRGAERFVFRARTDPKDAMPRRRCGEGRANITSSEAELNGRLRPSNRGRRHGVAAAEPPVRTRIFVFQPGGLGWTG